MAAMDKLEMRRLEEEYWLYQAARRELPSELLRLEETVFLQITPKEVSVMTSWRSLLPGREEGPWRGWMVVGPLDFSLVGVLAGISGILAESDIPLLVHSTFDTDYVFVAAAHLPAAEQALRAGGITVQTSAG